VRAGRRAGQARGSGAAASRAKKVPRRIGRRAVMTRVYRGARFDCPRAADVPPAPARRDHPPTGSVLRRV